MLYSVRDAAVAHRRRSLRTGRADKVGYLQHEIHLAAFQRFILNRVPLLEES